MPKIFLFKIFTTQHLNVPLVTKHGGHVIPPPSNYKKTREKHTFARLANDFLFLFMYFCLMEIITVKLPR